VVALAFQHPLVEGGPVVTDSPGQLDIGRAVATVAGDLEELPAETKVVSGFGCGEIRDTVRGHPDLRVRP